MESDDPYDGVGLTTVVQNVGEGKVKPLKRERKTELKELYHSLLKIVFFFLYLFIYFYYTQDPSSRPKISDLLCLPVVYKTIITHNLPIPSYLEVYFYLYLEIFLFFLNV
jgi:hypothetical protein